ncbi:hypothetical protein L596_015212 [Steinernema carpocapsae]|uniref:Uncharacterized protein n=1 Tax=Steinernema carpocapsae TaxID=34508 RepID=A0A4U5NEC1_STECR|nr:hypothetical protein L596_015212 [Steinernema carpocapsae]
MDDRDIQRCADLHPGDSAPAALIASSGFAQTPLAAQARNVKIDEGNPAQQAPFAVPPPSIHDSEGKKPLNSVGNLPKNSLLPEERPM